MLKLFSPRILCFYIKIFLLYLAIKILSICDSSLFGLNVCWISFDCSGCFVFRFFDRFVSFWSVGLKIFQVEEIWSRFFFGCFILQKKNATQPVWKEKKLKRQMALEERQLKKKKNSKLHTRSYNLLTLLVHMKNFVWIAKGMHRCTNVIGSLWKTARCCSCEKW